MKDFIKIMAALAVLIGITALVLLVSGVFKSKEPPRLLLQRKLKAVKVDGPAGHLTFGIEEASLDNIAGITNVRFSLLKTWQLENDIAAAPVALKAGPPPEAVKALDRKEICIIGFMFPSEAEGAVHVRSFFLVPTTQTCCYGPRPEYNQIVIVTLPEEIQYVRFKPIIVRGDFFVEPMIKDGYIYRMEGLEVAVAVEEEPVQTVDYAEIEKKGYTRFDFGLLEHLDNCSFDDRGNFIFPDELQSLQGKKVVVQGYYIGRYPLPYSKIGEKMLLGRYRVVEEGGRRTMFSNAVTVRFREDQVLPKIWISEAIVSGILHLHKNPRYQLTSGVVTIDEAIIGPPE